MAPRQKTLKQRIEENLIVSLFILMGSSCIFGASICYKVTEYFNTQHITQKDDYINLLKSEIDSCKQAKDIGKFNQTNKNVVNNEGTIDNKNGTFINGDNAKVTK